MRQLQRVFLAVALIICGLVPLAAPGATASRGGLLAGQSPAVASLREAETAFARAAERRDADAFRSFLAEDAVFLGAKPLQGSDAVLKAWAPFFRTDGPGISWAPDIVEIRAGGRSGITRGKYRVIGRGEDGKETVEEGVFTSIWERNPSGEWKIVFDAGCPPCECNGK